MINKDITRDGFVFGDHNGPWSTEHLTKAMTRETVKRIGFRMTTQEYRHIAIAIDRKFIRGKYADLDDDEEDDDGKPPDLFAGGEKSGLAIQDPKMDAKNHLEDIIRKAKKSELNSYILNT